MTTFDIFTNQRQIWKDYKDFYTLARRALPFIVGVVIGGLIFASDEGYLTNLYTEVLSIVATVGILDFFYQRRDTNSLKKRLVREAGSRSNETAKSAIEWLREKGWLTGEIGLLQGAELGFANLQGANLANANLQQTRLNSAKLQEADLRDANLQGAELGFVNLQGANLWGTSLNNAELLEANLKNADLWFANLQQADLGLANLQKAKLNNANLQGANLMGANLKEANLQLANIEGVTWEEEIADKSYPAILPDGTEWTPDVDMTRFTNPFHPNAYPPPTE